MGLHKPNLSSTCRCPWHHQAQRKWNPAAGLRRVHGRAGPSPGTCWARDMCAQGFPVMMGGGHKDSALPSSKCVVLVMSCFPGQL